MGWLFCSGRLGNSLFCHSHHIQAMFGMATMTVNVATLYDKSREVFGHPAFMVLQGISGSR
jgi:hypothetical protein